MDAKFRVLTTPAFERDFRKALKGDTSLANALAELVRILADEPHNRRGTHQIKKLTGVKSGEGQWRIRWRDYRLRYDIFGSEVVMHSFRNRKDAY